MGSRHGSLVPLLSNYACHVAEGEAALLHFTCRGWGQTMLLAAAGLTAALAIVPYMLLMHFGGTPRGGLLIGLMAVTVAFWSIHLAVQRFRKHGEFLVDGQQRVLRRYRAGIMLGEFDLDLVDRVGLVLDPTDAVRFTHLPSWLQVTLCTGETFRLAKGSPEELEPVCDALRTIGLDPRD